MLLFKLKPPTQCNYKSNYFYHKVTEPCGVTRKTVSAAKAVAQTKKKILCKKHLSKVRLLDLTCHPTNFLPNRFIRS